MKSKLRIIRENAGFSQHKTADRCGISYLMYLYIEEGKRMGSFKTWRNIQNCFGIKDEDMWPIILDTLERVYNEK